MILGIGVDSIEISRVVKAMEKEHFVHRIFTEKERAEMEHAKSDGICDCCGRRCKRIERRDFYERDVFR